MLFPHRYRGITRKCTREDPVRRYGGMEEVRKALDRADKRWRWVPFLALSTLLVLSVLLPLRRPGDNRPDDPNLNVTLDQKAYLKAAKWQINDLLQETIREAERGETYREVLMAKLSKQNTILGATCTDLSRLYVPGSSEHLYFITQFRQEQETAGRVALEAIQKHAPSFEEAYGKGNINARKCDSLRWVISPQVVMLPVADVTDSSAVIGVDLPDATFAEGSRIGVCWGPCHNPSIDGSHAELPSSGRKVAIDGLAPGSTYFVRGYVLTGAGITYGNEISFPTTGGTPTIPEGALPGLFSVGPGTQVYFSKGNLQYRASTDTWRFAARQWDCVGQDNRKRSSVYDGWIDLFGWGTSGNNHGAVDYQPWSGNVDTQSDALHYAYGKPDNSLDDGDGRADWGSNRIVNGGNEEFLWRTPEVSEWVYLLFVRSTASGVHFAKAQVAGVNGLLLLPDNWGIAVYPLNSTDQIESDFASNRIPEADWASCLEPAGAVFLPEAGANTISSVFAGIGGYYTSTAAATDAWHLQITLELVDLNTRGHRGDGLSVRLVRDARP